jgi:hypothetical protein
MVLEKPEQPEGDELMIAVQLDLDKIVTKEVCDAVYETAALSTQEVDKQLLDKECKGRKDVITGVIANSVNLQRLYFIVRSSIMGGITGLLTYSIISLFKITDFFALVFLGIIVFFVSLAVSRIMDRPVVRISNLTILYLSRHKKIKDFILRRF